MPPAKDESIRETNCIDIHIAEKSPAKNSTLVDVRACNKPATKVWFRGVRSSKFRHVYGVPFKRERCYDNIKITRNAHDSNFCAVNPKFVAVVTEVAGGGAFLVLPLDHTGRLDFNASRVTGHKGPVLDIKWNPFNDNIIASCSDDCTVKLWHIPDGGLSMHLTEWLVELHGHKRRAAHVEWHPTAENVLFSAGFDYLIFVWDVGKGEATKVIDCHTDVIYCMSFNRDGSLLATTSKDKKLRVIEPRSGIVVSEGTCHQGTKASKCTFLGNQGKVLTTGFSRYSDRQYAVWDQHDLGAPLTCETIDSSSGVVFPYYDCDTNMVYLAGKGDGNIRYYEVVDDAPYVHFLNQFLSGNPQRGLGFMPKRGLNTAACEVFRFYKLHTSRGLCEPISMIVPRKSDCFQEDLYPDTAAPLPSLSARDWLSGMNAPPVLISMKTGVTITTHKPRTASKDAPAMQPQDANNRKKFAFLSRETTPDYRPLVTWHEDNYADNHVDNNIAQINEKNQKTNLNQTTKFHQLQKMFGKQGGDEQPVPLYKQINQGDVFSTENELRLAFNRQGDELRIAKKQLQNSQQRVRELEQQVAALQSRLQRENS
ncbi:coronin-2B isoform X4 [Plutella xylostella]|uniref:coronin-2B isoform X1 n=1 Tax=Plutella xylostella TaxID=51655 RepID=UPI0020326FAA|nr:coronin-2B isoform X1 [Plutella xylostella]XP_048478945.1 coronin-2B isoform X4 [Plutella xylostella]